MKLFTKAIEKRLIKNFEINKNKEKIVEHKVVVKLFNPTGLGTWYLTEMNPETQIAFGLADITVKELGYISVTELKQFKGVMGLGIQRDKMFESNKKTLKECEAL
jgi:hypothetical protein